MMCSVSKVNLPTADQYQGWVSVLKYSLLAVLGPRAAEEQIVS